jgi:hypothetical protein
VFFFSSILVPPLTNADRSRMAILELDALIPGSPRPVLDKVKLRQTAGKMLRRLMDQWDRWQETFSLYADALGRVGHDARGQDQLATLLTAADLVLYDGVPDTDTLNQWAEHLMPEREQEEAADHAQCLAHLAHAQPEYYRGGTRKSVAQLIEEFVALNHHMASDRGTCVEMLATGGLTLKEIAATPEAPKTLHLCVANTHRGTRALFDGTRWAGDEGLPGVWVQALRRVPGAFASNQRIGGYMTRCTALPCDLFPSNDADGGGAADTSSATAFSFSSARD